MDAVFVGAYLLAAGASDVQQDPLYALSSNPWVLSDGHAVAGVFRHVEVGVTPNTMIDVSGLTSLVSPDIGVKRQVVSGEGVAVAVTGSFSVPTYGLRLMQGTPLTQDEFVPWTLIPGLGVTAGVERGPVRMSAGLLGRAGLQLQRDDQGLNELTDTEFGWLDEMIAPITHGWAAAGIVAVDVRPTDRWKLGVEGRVQVPAGPDLNLRVLGTRYLGERHGLTVGWVGASSMTEGGRRLHQAPRVDYELHFGGGFE
ncbi:MAG: hypothetical protein GY913_23860 [Proteobacteria bacterium]|nr:hypothetical protein [Pseudomonadota bacterium]MCP4919950.1 hypothetical protein [Pseudomonadota bacterium]